MGKRSINKLPKNFKNPRSPTLQNRKEGVSKLSQSKKSELNKVIEKLSRITNTLGFTNNGNKIFDTHLEIERLLHKIMNIEDEIDRELPERNKDSIEKLTGWMVENKARIDGVEVEKFNEFGYGLRAVKDVKEGDLMISVPRKLMLTTEQARKSELEFLVKNDTLLMHMPNIILALLLLVEKFKKDSFWEHYIRALPSSYTTVMYFSSEELDALRGSPVFESSLKQCRSIARQYCYLHKLFQKSSDPASDLLRDVFTYKQYRWAVSTVMTRQNLIPTRTPESPMTLALIPFWDMGNHANAKLTTDYNVESEESEYYSCGDFPCGEQVFMSYGARPNSDVFLHNGFVHVDNEHDGIRLKLGISKSDALGEARVALLKELAVPQSGEFLLSPGPLEGKLLAFLRIFNMEKDHLEQWMANEKKFDLLHRDCSVDTSLENKVWQFLSTRIKLLLATYPTSLQADEETIKKKKDMAPCMKLAVLQRFTEKRILHNVLNYVEDHLKQ